MPNPKRPKRVTETNRGCIFPAFLVWAVFLFLLASCGNNLRDGLTYTGSSTIGENIIPPAFKEFSKRTGARTGAIDDAGSGKGMEAILSGESKLGGISRPLLPDEKRLSLHAVRIGSDGIVVFVNRNNPIRELSKQQLKAIFTGRIRNWKEVGGRDERIVVVTEILGEQRATMLEFQEIVMDGLPYLSDRQEVDRPAEQVSILQNTENAVISVSAAFAKPGIRAVSINKVFPSRANIRSGSYLITRPLILLTKGQPKGVEKKFLNFMLSPPGQRIVSTKFVPRRPDKRD